MSSADQSPVPSPAYLVAIGCSSGGLLALRSILGDLECHGLSAYVLAQHLSPDEETRLSEILAPHTHLTVEMAATGEPVRPDHLYICPAGQDLEVRDGRLLLIDPESSAPIAPSIDRLFRSVAQTCGERSVGLILSGTGQDGREGGALVLAAGGQLIVQSPAEASAPAMPNAALAACGEALCGDSQEIVRWLNRIETLCEQPRDRTPTDRIFDELIARVAQVTGLSLGRYKDGTLRRQTARHYQALGFDSLEAYFEHVKDDPEQLRQLQRRFLISVSRFFRDPEVFGALEQALRHLLAHKTAGDTIRVWIPACASGEEAYSILILLHEILGEHLEDFEVRVFATDLDQEALDAARAGLYPAEALSHLSAMRRERWFSQQGSLWRLDKALRELCVFCIHDLLTHPPFLNMDLISCRNLLIYVRPEQQAELFATFHYALRPSGLLLLGQSESVGASSNLFESIDTPHKLYRRRDSVVSRPPRLARYQPPMPLGYRLPTRSRSQAAPNPLRDAALDELVRAYDLSAVLVNTNFEPLQFFGHAKRYFALPDDTSDFSIFSLCLPELRTELKSLGYRLLQEQIDVLPGIGMRLRIGDQSVRIRPVARRIRLSNEQLTQAFLIVFEELPPDHWGVETEATSLDVKREDDEITRLRQELAETREYLQSVLDQRELAHEELQSLQEEIQVSTEELQTANEELQSSNEELTTLNDELRLKTNESTELSTTLANIQNSIRTALIVVDREGRITRFNALAVRIFGIVDDDIGNHLVRIPCHLALPYLPECLERVVSQGESVIERVHQGDFHYLMQIDPYRDEFGQVVGAVLNFSDISELHRAESAHAGSEQRFRQVWESANEGMLLTDESGCMVLVNPALERMFGYGPGELVGQPVEILVPESRRIRHRIDRAAFVAGSERGRAMDHARDLQGRCKEGTLFDVAIGLSNIAMDGGRFTLASVEDITERKRAERALRESEQRLRLALDAARAGTWEWDVDDNRNYWSEHIWTLYGLSPHQADASYESWRDSIHPEDRERVVRLIQETIAQRMGFEVEWRVNLPPGEPTRWLLSRGQPIAPESDRSRRYIGTVIDITAQKEAEQRAALAGELKILQTLLDTSFAGYFDWNIAEGTEYLSPTFKRMFGYADDELPNTPESWQRLVFPEDLPRVFEVYERHVRSRGAVPYHNEVRYRHKDGRTIWVICAGLVVDWTPEGAPKRMVGCHIDITDLKQVEQALSEARDQANASNLAKSAFLANMSHEIRTPMNAVLGFCYLLEQRALDPTSADLVRKIHGAGQALLGLINDILDFSKIEAGHLEIESTPFQLSELLDTLAGLMTAAAGDKPLELVLTPPGEGIEGLIGDAGRLQQVLINLLGNAIKFTARGEVELRVEQVAEHGDRLDLRFTVRDTGIGIAPEHQTNIFNAFSQADNSIGRRFGGTGLGLAISQRLVHMMGGRLELESTLGQGSAFYFTLALQRDPNAPDPAAELGRLRLLVVEDCATAGAALVQTARALGWRVDLADSSAAAQEHLAARLALPTPYDAVLIDWRMPGEDGLSCARALRAAVAKKGLAGSPALMLMTSAQSRPALEAQPEIAMIDAILDKPVTPSSLYNALASLRGARRRYANTNRLLSVGRRSRQLAGLRVLVVDDSEINQEVASGILVGHGAQVSVADDGEAALAWLDAHPDAVDIVLMDVQMPRLDGYAATRRLRLDRRWRNLPVIALTAGAFQSMQEAARAAGMNDFVAKPFNVAQLIACIQRWSGTAPADDGVTDPEPAATTAADPPSESVRAPDVEALAAHGIDLPTALERWGDPQIYRTYLLKFRDGHADDACTIAAAIQTEALAEGGALAHKLTGVAATLALPRVAALARTLEQTLHEGRTPEASLVTELQTALADVLSGLHDWAEATCVPQAVPVERTALDHETLGRHFGDLLRAIATQDLNGAESCLKPLRAALDEERLDAIQRCLDDFDFRAAESLTRTLSAELAPVIEPPAADVSGASE
ncbi:PAS domain S-box protein [Allochromatium vinosum]|uniref:PAS domain S-box protein n=1 Tax=Allochromatium vinosum TaxID=1049 RepID=UPI0019069A3A|nr:PAS domain S-box protein [Allochromatium vinosum]MBK1653295.1 hypothetical protein [Allochromatium vinosum]